ncbi:MAG: methyltransferase, TIGR04325 family [Patescibacteria group bacterium]|nr:methyltransferase, TIGR04325 family [Patescibacteria group bacterium]
METAPITLFVYNRPKHTKKTVEALQKNFLSKESTLFIFSDGYKNKNDKKNVAKVRNYLKTISGFRKITIIERNKNFGLSKSIILGVTEIINKYKKIIVLEDDLVTSPYFLSYMNKGLALYKEEGDVISIHGYIYPMKGKFPETFFIKGADCWGWATWKRGWDIFNPDGKKLLEGLKTKKLSKQFDFDRNYNYTKMLRNQIDKKNDSWAIRWYASAFLSNKLTLYPKKSLVQNIGIDDSGTHCKNSTTYKVSLSNKEITVKKIPIIENKKVRKKIIKYFKSVRKNSFYSFLKKIRIVLIKILKNITPPIILKISKKKPKYGFFGNYKTWKEALKRSGGYDDEKILEKVKESLLKIKNREAVYERDSFLFNKTQYSWPITTSLLWVKSQNNDDTLNIIDFGGSLGSSYYQNKKFLDYIKNLRWNIIEQKNFVQCGKEYFQDNQLKFYKNIDDCLKETKPDTILISSTIQYLENPYKFLQKIINYNFKFIIFDRTTFLKKNSGERITIQKVSPKIYDASYPTWFLNEQKFLEILNNKYNLIEDFLSLPNEIILGDKTKAVEKGFIFKRK